MPRKLIEAQANYQITEYRNHTFQKREKGEYLSQVKAWRDEGQLR